MEDILSTQDLYKFSMVGCFSVSKTIMKAEVIIKLFDFFYNIDVSNYPLHDIVFTSKEFNGGEECIPILLSKYHYKKISRGKKINTLLK